MRYLAMLFKLRNKKKSAYNDAYKAGYEAGAKKAYEDAQQQWVDHIRFMATKALTDLSKEFRAQVKVVQEEPGSNNDVNQLLQLKGVHVRISIEPIEFVWRTKP